MTQEVLYMCCCLSQDYRQSGRGCRRFARAALASPRPLPDPCPFNAGTRSSPRVCCQPATHSQQTHTSTPIHHPTTTTCIQNTTADDRLITLGLQGHTPRTHPRSGNLTSRGTSHDKHSHTATKWQPHLLSRPYATTSPLSTPRPQIHTVSSSGDATPASPPTMTEVP